VKSTGNKPVIRFKPAYLFFDFHSLPTQYMRKWKSKKHIMESNKGKYIYDFTMKGKQRKTANVISANSLSILDLEGFKFLLP